MSLMKATRYFLNLKQCERKSIFELHALQFKSLIKTLRFAYDEIPFYRDRFNALKLTPKDIRNWNDFEQFPFTSKSEIRNRKVSDFLSLHNFRNAWKSQTTGSSGIPITIYRNSETDALAKALMQYGFYRVGVRPYDRFAQLMAFLSEKPNPPGLVAKLGLKRFYGINLRLSDQEILNQLNYIKPHILYSFPSALFRLAEFMEHTGFQCHPKILISQGEVLPEPWRNKIESVFGVPLYHTYGSTEFPRIGFECKNKNGYRLLPQAAIVEIIDEKSRSLPLGEEGEIVLTHLNNYLMPFIRYRIGDHGMLSKRSCSCGIRYPLLEQVTGRMDDYLVLPSGQRVSARAVTHMQFDGILQYKIVQKSPELIEVLVIPSSAFNEETKNKITKVLSAGCFKEKVQIQITPVESLPTNRSGKLQLVSREF